MGRCSSLVKCYIGILRIKDACGSHVDEPYQKCFCSYGPERRFNEGPSSFRVNESGGEQKWGGI